MIVGLNEARGDALVIQPIDQLLLVADSGSAPIAATPTSSAPPVADDLRRELPTVVVLSVTAALALLLGGLLVYLASRRRRGTESLSEIEREARLNEIKTWLAAEKLREQGDLR